MELNKGFWNNTCLSADREYWNSEIEERIGLLYFDFLHSAICNLRSAIEVGVI